MKRTKLELKNDFAKGWLFGWAPPTEFVFIYPRIGKSMPKLNVNEKYRSTSEAILR